MSEENGFVALPNIKYEHALWEVIESQLKKSKDDFDILVMPGSAKGDNYAGVVYRVQVNEKDTKQNRLNLIVKVPHSNPLNREMGTPELFKREADFYDIVYPMYKSFQELYRINVEKDGFHQVPLCYKTLTEEPFEGLFFDDLKTSDFLLYDRFKELTKEHVFLVMKTLAKMHAIFYAIKDQLPNLVQEFVEMKELFVHLSERENSPMEPWFVNLKKQTLDLVNKSGNSDMIQKITALLEPSFTALIKNVFDTEKIGPYATLCHGDCWNNNMLFKSDKNGTPIDIRFLDFQILRYASPVCDLMYYIFGCTTKPLRDKHYQEFLDVYYDELSSFMKKLGSDPEKVYPHEIFEKHLKVYGHFGLLMAMMVLPIFTMEGKDAPTNDEMMEKFTESGGVAEDFTFTTDNNRDKYEERMMGVCNDMYALGYI